MTAPDTDRLVARLRAAASVADQMAALGDPTRSGGLYQEAADRLQSLEADNARLLGEVAVARQDVVAFCAPWAVTYARDHGFPAGHLHPAHYDILERAGGRMVDFTRAALQPQEPSDAG